MADIKDIFGESDSEDDNDQQQAPVDVGKLFELSEDEEEAPIQRKRPAGRLQKNAAAAPKKKGEGGAYADEDDGVMDDADRAFIDNTDETDENKRSWRSTRRRSRTFLGIDLVQGMTSRPTKKRSPRVPTTKIIR